MRRTPFLPHDDNAADPFWEPAADDAAPLADAAALDATKPVWTLSQITANLTRPNRSWSTPGTPATVTFGFRTARPASGSEAAGFSPFSEAQKSAARLALQSWADAANLTFVETAAASAQIIFANTTSGPAQAWAYYPGSGVGGDVWINPNQSSNFQLSPGGYGLLTLIHEIGHALGLAHPGAYDASLGIPTYATSADYQQDSRQYTVMSYFDAYETGANHRAYNGSYTATLYAGTPVLHDVAAIQSLYGANTAIRTANTTYGFNSNAGVAALAFNRTTPPVATIVDAGGQDVLDLSGYTTAQRVDLHEGAFSDIGGLTANISIAFGTVIEAAIGGTGNDSLTGNDTGVRLDGGAGDDTLTGGAGNDALIGGSGTDTAAYAQPQSAYFITRVTATRYTITGPDGTDTLDDVEFLRFGTAAPVAISAVVNEVTVIETAGSTRLTRIGNRYYLRDGAGNGPALSYAGSEVTAGQFGAWAPIAAEITTGGYTIAWRRGSEDAFLVWNTDATGAYSLSATAIVTAADEGLQALEPAFAQDINADGRIGPLVNPIETAGATRLLQRGTRYVLADGTGQGPLLSYQGREVQAGDFGDWSPIGVERAGTGYLLAWQRTGQNAFVLWNLDAAGAYASHASGILTGADLALQAAETTLLQDLNTDSQIGPATIVLESIGATRLIQRGNRYALADTNGNGPFLAYGGNPVTVGQFGAFTPFAAERQTDGTYDVAWHIPGGGTFVVWSVASDGSRLSGLTGAVPAGDVGLELLEPAFGQDLDGDGRIGAPSITIEAAGTTRLVQYANRYALQSASGTGPQLSFLGAPVTPGQFGAFAPIAAEATPTGYRVVWSLTGADLYTVWNTDTAGAYLSHATPALPGTAYEIQSLEPTFAQDLNADGRIGPPTRLIEAAGATRLTQSANRYLLTDSAGTGPSLSYEGGVVTEGQFGAFTPIAAEATADGYRVVWSLPGGNIYVVWSLDSTGAYLAHASGALSATSHTLQSFETDFAQDLNTDGTIGPTARLIEANGPTRLMAIADRFRLDTATTPGPFLAYNASPVTAGQFGVFTPIAAEATPTGYQLVWQQGREDGYVIWNLDPTGALTGSPTGLVSGVDFTLQQRETAFAQDLNADGRRAASLILGTPGPDAPNLTALTNGVTVNLASNAARAALDPETRALTFIGQPDIARLPAGPATLQFALSPDAGLLVVSGFQYGQDSLNLDLQAASPTSLQALDATWQDTPALYLTTQPNAASGVLLLGFTSEGGTTAPLAGHLTFRAGHALIA